jgi:hypothetical protein
MTYTPVAADEGYYLKATASYDDGFGSDKTEMASTTSAVTAADPLLAKYDVITRDGVIDREEAIAAITSYLLGETDVSRAEAIAVIQRYLLGN